MDSSTTYDEMPTSVLQIVNERCNRFETDRLAGRAQPIDDYIVDLEDEAKTAVRAELLALWHEYEQSADNVPATIGGYDVLRCLGRGGMGSVYLARDPRLGRNVAVKVLRPALAADPAARERFRREALAAGRLDHPNVVPALDAGEENGRPYLVSSYIEGEDLAHLVRRNGPLDSQKAIDYVVQAARGLEHAHERGIVHRDVKPGNLILGVDGIVRILDLGLARIRDVAANDQTTTGFFMGTPSYAAPEQVDAPLSVDARTDVYGLGGVLHFLLTGRAPRPLEDFREIPADTGRALRKMLAADPKQRPASMAEVVHLLHTSNRPSRRAVLASGALAAAAAVGGVAIYLKPWRRGDSPPTTRRIDSPAAFSKEQQREADEAELPVEKTDEYGISFVLIPRGDAFVGTTREEIERLIAMEPDVALHDFIRTEMQRKFEVKRPFYLARTELTIGQMKAIVGARRRIITEVEVGDRLGYALRDDKWVLEPGRSWHDAGPEFPLTDDHPAINLTWNDAVKLAPMISPKSKDGPRYYVPTEDEWEYACLAGTEAAKAAAELPVSEDVAVFGMTRFQPVRSRQANRWGLFDMLGNLAEWCLASPATPRPEARLAPMRGGRFVDPVARIRPAARVWEPKISPMGGLRLALVAVPEPGGRTRVFGRDSGAKFK